MSTGCITPFYRKGENIPLPCGKCPGCIRKRASNWSVRLVKEGETSSSSFFVTLTYDTDTVPITKKGYMTLHKPDMQNYFKRLRKLNPHANIKYYAAGEYGGNTNRPHYHAIIFNATSNSIIEAWSLFGKEIGNTHIGTVSEASIGYTLKYISKEKRIPLHENDDRIPEFAIMSKNLVLSI